MICNNCNFNNDDNAVFCSKCGKKLNNQKSYGIGEKPYKNQKYEYNTSEQNYNFKKKPQNKKAKKTIKKLLIVAEFVALIIIIFLLKDLFNQGNNKVSDISDKKGGVYYETKKETGSKTELEQDEDVYDNNDKDINQESNNDTYTENNIDNDTEDDYSNSNSSSLSMNYVNYSNTQDYLNYSSQSDFATFYADGYSFGYPKNFFNYAEETDYGYRLTADNGGSLTVAVYPRSSDVSVKDHMERLYREKFSELYKTETVLHKYDSSENCGRFIVSGYRDSDKSAGVYTLYNVYEDKIETYSLVNIIHGYEKEELNHANYILDTVYRTVSFSKSSYRPRSYNQFINEDMGQKN
ncbi:MAG: hypothetical protein ACLRPW_05220 [Intestinibacter sp.]